MRLSGQAVDLLCLLLERPGELIPREEIERRLWPDRNVDFNHSLDVVVSRLRTVLGDKGSSPRYIETVPRKGYRFIELVTATPRLGRRISAIGVVDSSPTQPSRFSQRLWRFSLCAPGTTSLFRLSARRHHQLYPADKASSRESINSTGPPAASLRLIRPSPRAAPSSSRCGHPGSGPACRRRSGAPSRRNPPPARRRSRT